MGVCCRNLDIGAFFAFSFVLLVFSYQTVFAMNMPCVVMEHRSWHLRVLPQCMDLRQVEEN